MERANGLAAMTSAFPPRLHKAEPAWASAQTSLAQTSLAHESLAGESADAPAGARRSAALQRVLDCDVCVVGDDIAGLLIAGALALRGRQVVLLPTGAEAFLPLDAALAPGFALPAMELVARVGAADARELFILSTAAAGRGLDLAAGAGVPLGPKGRLAVARPRAAPALRREYEARERLLPDSHVLVDAADTEALLETDLFTAAFGVVPAHRVDPRALRAAFQAAAAAAGVQLLPAAPGLVADLGGLRKYLSTPKLKVRAFEVVFSGGPAVARVVRDLAPSLVATPWVAGAFHLAGRRPPYAGLVEETGLTGLRFHWDGAQLAVAAATATRVRGRGACARVLRRHAREVYPGAGAALVDRACGLVLAETRRRMPVIQEIAKGVWLAACCGDEEPAQGLLAADLIVGAVADRDDRIRLLEPFGIEGASARPPGRLRSIAGYWHLRLAAHLPAAPEPEAATPPGSELPPPHALPSARPAAAARPGPRTAAVLSRQAARAALGLALRRRGETRPAE